MVIESGDEICIIRTSGPEQLNAKLASTIPGPLRPYCHNPFSSKGRVTSSE